MWTPEMVAAAFALHAAEYPMFYRSRGVRIVRTLLTKDELPRFRAKVESRRAIFRERGRDAWQLRVYMDVCDIINERHDNAET